MEESSSEYGVTGFLFSGVHLSGKPFPYPTWLHLTGWPTNFEETTPHGEKNNHITFQNQSKASVAVCERTVLLLDGEVNCTTLKENSSKLFILHFSLGQHPCRSFVDNKI